MQSQTQPQPVVDQGPPPSPDPTPQAPNPAAPKKPAPTTNPADNGIPQLPPVQPETTPTPKTAVPSRTVPMKVPAGTVVIVRLLLPIDTRVNQTGQRFDAIVDLPVVLNGHTVIAQGSRARVVLTNFGGQARLELISITANGVNHVLRSNIFEKKGLVNGKPSPFVIVPASTRIQFTLRTPML